MTTWTSRIVDHGRVKVADLLANPMNWRLHPKVQQDALRTVIREVGYVRSVTINQRTGRMVDGHLRAQVAEMDGEQELDAEYIDVSEDDENIILATLDPIGALAVSDREKYRELADAFEDDNTRLRALIASFAATRAALPEGTQRVEDGAPGGQDGTAMRIMQLLYTPEDHDRLMAAIKGLQARWENETMLETIRQAFAEERRIG